ncbi:Fe-assimilating 2 [Chlorella sorokiniana]|uniref:Fe-assimilating 2 n=1 Tax=Chlorella sorokiniana TaxID=3076 RepID=A0A2P6TN26_CHLSO|nr:Fe-assimilating 2 [Chlorella sorokiniana]|eukprot:PRW45734.1 Fe-assimilating 2 [Chlorella sorokiniana]
MRLLATAALLLAACSACAAQSVAPNTTGITLGGHKFGSNVGGYALFPRDVCDIATVLSGNFPTYPNFTAATSIWASGKNVPSRNGGARSLKGFGTTYYTTPGPYRQMLKLLPIGMVMYNFMMHEVQSGLNRTETKSEGYTDIVEGAPHNLEEAWAMYAGSYPCGPQALVEEMSRHFGLMRDSADRATCESLVHNQIFTYFQRMYAAAKAGNAAAFRAAHNYFASTLLGTLKSTFEASRLAAAGKDPMPTLGKAVGYWKAIEAVVASAKPASAIRVNSALDMRKKPSATAYNQVKAALEAAYPILGVKKSLVGTLGARTSLSCDGSKFARA